MKRYIDVYLLDGQVARVFVDDISSFWSVNDKQSVILLSCGKEMVAESKFEILARNINEQLNPRKVEGFIGDGKVADIMYKHDSREGLQ